jgi:hypothetical protein
VHLVSYRPVLDQLHHRGAVHDRAGRGREVLADRKAPSIDLRREAAVVHEIADEIFQSVYEACAAGVDELLQRRGIAGERVGRRHRVHDERDDEPRTLGIALVDLCIIHKAIERVAPGQVALCERAVGDALSPSRIGKAPVLGVGREFACAGRDASELGEQDQILLGGGDGMAQNLPEQQTCGIENVLPAHADQRIGRQGVLSRLFANVTVGAN